MTRNSSLLACAVLLGASVLWASVLGVARAQVSTPPPENTEGTTQRQLSIEPKVLDEQLLRTVEGGEVPTGAVSLDDVMRSVDAFHPKITMSRAKQQALEAKRLAESGAFDPTLTAKSRALRGGYYETTVGDAELRQYLGLWGSEVYGGYRIGLPEVDDRYPTYEKSETLGNGELRAGLSVPLWRDGPTDERRAAIAIAESMARAGGFDFSDAQLDVKLAAITAYFDWLAAGHLLDIAERLLKLAETRRQQVVAQRDAGSASDFEVTDSEQMVFARQDAVAVATQKLQSSAITLSLYFRDDEGRPRILDRAVLPPFRQHSDALANLDPDRLSSCHPRYRALAARIDAAKERAELADNQIAPEARAMFEVSRDLGSVGNDIDLAGTNYTAGIEIKVPLLLRKGRGASAAADYELKALRDEATWIRDKLGAVSRKAMVDQRAALRRAEVATELVGATELLAEGERYRLNAGGSTMLVVNLREMAVARAASKLIYALAELNTIIATIHQLNDLHCD